MVKVALRHPIAFNKRFVEAFGVAGEMKLVKDSVRVTCTFPQQKTRLLQATMLGDKTIKVTEPWFKSDRTMTGDGPSTRLVRGIIFDISPELSEQDIAEETKAKSARRITRWISGEKQVTRNVVLSFDTELPSHVVLGFIRCKVRPYIPSPLRCNNCQIFGHHAAQCKRQVRCVRCGENHNLTNCPIRDRPTEAVCVNCGDNHSAAYRGCCKYKEVSEILKVSVTKKHFV